MAQASEVSGLTAATICNAENGKHTPTAKTLNKLSEAYTCKVSDFYEADIQTVRTLATNVIVGYFNDPKYNADRKAQIASHLLTQLPETTPTEEEDTSKSLDEVLRGADTTQT